MGILRNAVIVVTTVSIITFIALFGQLPALRKTPIGWLQRLLCLHIPSALRSADRQLTGGRTTEQSRYLINYLFYKKNPVVLIIFLGLLTGSATLFLWNAFHLLSTSLLIPIPLLLCMPYLFTYLCATHSSHYIVEANHSKRLHDYPYDHILFRPHTDCSTCRLTKPARSKHCSLCDHCVAKSDHHCPWVNACLGQGNYRWFLALLLSLGILEIYGAYMSWWILRPWLHLEKATPFFSIERARDLIEMLGRAVTAGGLSIAGVGMLTISTALLPLALLAYHLYLIWAGMTTNESQKWADWQDDMADGLAFIGSRAAIRAHLNNTRQLRSKRNGSSSNANIAGEERFLGISIDENDEPRAAWPLRSDQIIVRTKDGKPPEGQESLWKRVWDLDDVVNIYDLGGWRNLVEVYKGR